VGEDPFRATLDRVIAGQRAQGLPIVARRMGEIAPGSGCKILYAAGSRAQPVAEILAATDDEAILTVTDDERAPHGVVHFVERGGKVRLLVDTNEAAGRGLALSSKLLGLSSVERE
jgi:hypothetical protein